MENSLISDQAAIQPPNNLQPKNDSFMLPSSFKVRLRMLSDWHVGTGAGRPGSIDSLLARGADDLPFIPAKTLNGIWRDALERLTLGLDNGNERGDWSKWVEAIFGNQPALQGANPTVRPNPSLLEVRPARLSEGIRARIDEAVKTLKDKEEQKRQRQKLLSALTFIKPGVAIDEKTGTAKPDFLRFEEMGRVETVLEAGCELAEMNEIISALLILSAKLGERLGGKRRRGAGLCELKVCDENGKVIDTKGALAWLDKNRTAPSCPMPSDRIETFSLSKNTTDGEWQTLGFSLRLLTPVSIVTTTLGNVSESLDFIPGTYLLPYLTKKLGKRIFQAVAYGDLQVLPATIEINGQRGLPVPLVLAQHKAEGSFDKKGTIYNKLANEITDDTPQLKPFRSGYVQALESAAGGANKLPSFTTTPKTLLLHNTVQDEVQRPTEAVGGVYSREAIAADVSLRGEMRWRKKVAEDFEKTLGANWWTKIEGTVRLGTSRKDDYGLAKLELYRDKDENGKNVIVKKIEPNPKLDSHENKKLTVYLLSDCLLRNTHLRQTKLVEDLAKELGKNLGITLKPIKPTKDETTSLVMMRRIESWHEGWGLPRPTLMAMSAGSCVVFDVDGSLDAGKLQQVEAAGIGERRGEGYGQIRFNPPLLIQGINDWQEADPPGETQAKTNILMNKLSKEEEEFARLIEETAWREELKVAVLKIADDRAKRQEIFGFEIVQKEKGKESYPPMSQIGGLRSAISRLKDESDKKVVTDWLEHLHETKNRRDKWARSATEARDKIKRIKNLITEDTKVWLILCETKISGTDVWQSPPTLVREPEKLRIQFWAEAVRSLFDACARAHKRDLEK